MWQTFTFLDPAGNLLAQSETFRRGGMDQRRADRVDDGSRRSVGNDAGDAGDQCAVRRRRRGADAQRSGEFSILLERVGVGRRGGSSLTLTVRRRERARHVCAEAQWKRMFVRCESWAGDATSVTFGVAVGCGRVRRICSGCRWRRNWRLRTTRLTGTMAAFIRMRDSASDQITVTAQGTDVFDAVIQIVRWHGAG